MRALYIQADFKVGRGRAWTGVVERGRAWTSVGERGRAWASVDERERARGEIRARVTPKLCIALLHSVLRSPQQKQFYSVD